MPGMKTSASKKTNNEKSKKKKKTSTSTWPWTGSPCRWFDALGAQETQDPRTPGLLQSLISPPNADRSIVHTKKTKHKSAMGVWDSLWNCQTGIVWAAKRNENAPWRQSQKWTSARFHQEHKCLNLIITQFKFVQKRHHEKINLPS